MKNCLICNRIEKIKNKTNPYFVAELKTGYVVLGDHQFYKGYTLFLCKKHVSELHELDDDFKKEYLHEMSLVSKAVFEAFKPKRMNYELLGNADPHLHWHIFPRYANDPDSKMPVWVTDKDIRCSNESKPKIEELEQLKQQLKTALQEKIAYSRLKKTVTL